MTRDEIEEAIRQINEDLKGTDISRVERLLMNEDRRDLRNLLAQMDGRPVQLSPFDLIHARSGGKT